MYRNLVALEGSLAALALNCVSEQLHQLSAISYQLYSGRSTHLRIMRWLPLFITLLPNDENPANPD
jgi:hypothetical protein